MGIELYRETTNERFRRLEKIRKSVKRLQMTFHSAELYRILNLLYVVETEIESDLRAHERVASEDAAKIGVQA